MTSARAATRRTARPAPAATRPRGQRSNEDMRRRRRCCMSAPAGPEEGTSSDDGDGAAGGAHECLGRKGESTSALVARGEQEYLGGKGERSPGVGAAARAPQSVGSEEAFSSGTAARAPEALIGRAERRGAQRGRNDAADLKRTWGFLFYAPPAVICVLQQRRGISTGSELVLLSCSTGSESVLLSCSNTPSWPSRSGCRDSAVTLGTRVSSKLHEISESRQTWQAGRW